MASTARTAGGAFNWFGDLLLKCGCAQYGGPREPPGWLQRDAVAAISQAHPAAAAQRELPLPPALIGCALRPGGMNETAWRAGWSGKRTGCAAGGGGHHPLAQRKDRGTLRPRTRRVATERRSGREGSRSGGDFRAGLAIGVGCLPGIPSKPSAEGLPESGRITIAKERCELGNRRARQLQQFKATVDTLMLQNVPVVRGFRRQPSLQGAWADAQGRRHGLDPRGPPGKIVANRRRNPRSDGLGEIRRRGCFQIEPPRPFRDGVRIPDRRVQCLRGKRNGVFVLRELDRALKDASQFRLVRGAGGS